MTARSEVYLYVLELTIDGEYGWTSLHHTFDGAIARLEQRVDEYGVRDEYELIREEQISGKNCAAAGEEGDTVVYGITYLPVEQ